MRPVTLPSPLIVKVSAAFPPVRFSNFSKLTFPRVSSYRNLLVPVLQSALELSDCTFGLGLRRRMFLSSISSTLYSTPLTRPLLSNPFASVEENLYSITSPLLRPCAEPNFSVSAPIVKLSKLNVNFFDASLGSTNSLVTLNCVHSSRSFAVAFNNWILFESNTMT